MSPAAVHDQSRSGAPLSPSRGVGWGGIAVVLLGYVVVLGMEVALVLTFPDLGLRLSQATRGLVSVPLAFSAVLAGILALILFRRLHLRPQDVGLVRERVRGGIAVYLGLWVTYQVLFVALDAFSHQPLGLASSWSQPASYPAVLGVFLTYTLGVALTEEVLFRGFLVPQVWQTLHVSYRTWIRLALTLGISQGIFTLIHIPELLLQGTSLLGLLAGLIPLFVLGVLLALLYLQTQNLFVAVAVHALADEAIPLLHQSVLTDTSVLAPVAAIVLLLLWPVVTGQNGLREALRPSTTSR